MVEFEADDAMGAAAALAAKDERVTRVFLCTPDKDLGQCVVGTRVVQLDRRKGIVVDEDGVREKFGVGPESIPDYLALVGDSADGFPGLARFRREDRVGDPRRATPTSRTSRPWVRSGISPACATCLASPTRSPRTSSSRTCSAASPRSSATSTSARSTTGSGRGPTDRFAAMCEKLGSKTPRGARGAGRQGPVTASATALAPARPGTAR